MANGAAGPDELLRLVIDSSPGLLSYLTPELRFRFANKAYADWFGVTPESLTGTRLADLFGPANFAQIEWHLRYALNGNAIEFERTFRTESRERHVRARYVPDIAEDGAIRGILVQVTDISAQTAAERALRENEQQFRTLLANTPDVISRFDRQFRFLYISPAAEKVTGHKPEFHIGKRHAEVGVDPELSAGLEAVLEEIFTTGEMRTASFEIPGPQGAARRYEGIGIPERDETGAVRTVLTIVRDVTRQFEAIEALRESENRFRTIVETASEGIWIIDNNGATTFVNDRMCHLLGYAPGEMLGKRWSEFIAPEDLARGRQGVDARREGNTDPAEYRLRRKDSSTVWVQFTGNRMLGEGGEVTGLLAMCTDVSGRVTRDELLRASEERYRSLVTATSSIVWTAQPDGSMFLDNGQWTAYTGAPMPDGPQPWNRFLHPDDVPGAVRAWLNANTAKTVLEHSARVWHHASQQFRWCVTRAVALRNGDGTVREWVGTITDIHDRREAEARYEALFSAFRDGLLLVNDEGVYIDVNPSFCALVKCSRDDLIGQRFGPLIPPDRLDEAVSAFVALKRDGKFSGEFPLLASDGTVIEVEWQSVANALPGIHFCTARDITARKRFEQQLQQTQKLESLGVLAGGIAHDFNNLLVGVMGNASLAMDAVPETSPARPMLTDVVKASDRAAQLTRQLLAYAGKARLATEPVDLTSLVKELTGLLGASIPKTVHLRLQLPNRPMVVEAENAQIQQVVMNLVINGAEAIPNGMPGAVTVSVEERTAGEPDRERAIVPLPEGNSRFIVLAVADTGCGMTPEVRERIFDPFFTTKFQGRGLGLSAVLGIVRSHHGGMTLDTQPGKGTTFEVLLPPTESEPRAQAAEPVQKPPEAAGTVLVADDEEVVQTFLRRLLTRAGYQVITAGNGAEAIRLTAEHPEISVILLDLAMPELSGDQAAPELRRIRPDVPIVLSSGYPETEALSRFASTGVSAFLQKPYSNAALLNKLRELIGQP